MGGGGGYGELSFGSMLLRMFRDGAVGDQTECYERLGGALKRNNDRTPRVRVLWGSLDAVADEGQIRRIIHLLGGGGGDGRDESSSDGRGPVSFSRMEGLEHNLLLSHPEGCAEDIASFLRRA